MWRRHPQEMPRPETENENISTNWKQPWSGKLPCWGTAWHLSDQEKVTSMQALQPPHKERTVIPSGLISLNWQTKQWPNRSCGQGKSGTWLLTLTLSDWQRKNALMFWSSGVLESRLKIPVCWRFLFGHLTTLPHASVSLLFFSFDTLPFGVCFNIICSSRNLCHVFYAVPHMVRSWGNCSW